MCCSLASSRQAPVTRSLFTVVEISGFCCSSLRLCCTVYPSHRLVSRGVVGHFHTVHCYQLDHFQEWIEAYSKVCSMKLRHEATVLQTQHAAVDQEPKRHILPRAGWDHRETLLTAQRLSVPCDVLQCKGFPIR